MTAWWIRTLVAIAAVAMTAVAAAGPVDMFTIGVEEVVSDGVPGPGAGNIETAGATDVYELTVAPGTRVYFDELSGSCLHEWICVDDQQNVVFDDGILCSGDPGTIELTAGGTYTITVSTRNDATGTYSFTVWELAPPDSYVIGYDAPVSDGVPGPGAGNLEEPGATDEYTFTGTMGDRIYFDEQSGSCSIRWRIMTPGGAELFNDGAICVTDPALIELPETGTYSVEVYTISGSTGTYGFELITVPAPQFFNIAIKQQVSDGIPAPGAGNIEIAGAQDFYTFTAAAGTQIYADELTGPCGGRWRCTDAMGTVVFNDTAICSSDPGVLTLDLGGTYTIEVYGIGDTTGTYAFVLWELNAPESFAIGLDEVVSDGVPAPGAGNIEEPGAIDRYTFTGIAGSIVYVDEIGGECGIRWSCTTPSGAELFNDGAICSADPGEMTLPEDGTYTIEVFATGSVTGTYTFEIVSVAVPQIFVIDIDDVVSDGVPGPGAGNIEEPGSLDRYLVTRGPGEEVELCFRELGGSCSLLWRAFDVNGTVLFEDNVICVGDPGVYTFDEGTTVIEVYSNAGVTGTYTFEFVPRITSDIDRSCRVDFDDLALLLGCWGTVIPGCEVADTVGGLSAGVVDFDDLSLLLGEWMP